MLTLPQFVIGVGAFLFVISILDLKSMRLPSILTTSAVFAISLVAVYRGTNYIIFGLLAFVFAWWLKDFKYIEGVADIKAAIIVGLMIANLQQFLSSWA